MDLLDCRAAEVAAGPQCLVARQTHTIIFDWKVEPNGPQLGVAAGVHYPSTASGWSANSGCCPDFARGRETAPVNVVSAQEGLGMRAANHANRFRHGIRTKTCGAS
jgi:hypothetical protein